jgi:hypothetical protein
LGWADANSNNSPLLIEEQNGTNAGRYRVLQVTNGTSTNNNDGSIYVNTGGGGGGGGGTPTGAKGYIQFYDVQGTVTQFGGNSGLYYSGTGSTVGNVGIGTITPIDYLTVQSGSTGGVTINGIPGSNPTITTFNSSGTFTPSVSGTVTVCVVGGGGGGGDLGGGGGGSQVLCNNSYSVTNGVGITVTIGAGGAGSSSASSAGSNGGSSVFGTLTAIGGGGGGSNSANPASGASGGGGGSTGSSQSGATGTAGNSGGSNNSSSPFPSGGGGGCGGVGGTGATTVSGGGGIGCSESISGSAVYYGGGGSGGWRANSGGTGTSPASGGGGAGSGSSSTGTAGTANTGGGGGGGGYDGSFGAGGNGGSGIVIVSTNPQTMPTLSFNGNSSTISKITASTGTGSLSLINNGITAASINNVGNFGINSTNPGQQLDVQGTVRMTGFDLNLAPLTNGYVLVENNVGIGTWMSPSSIGAGGSGSGTVTSVTLASPNSTLTLGGTNPVTTSGTINADFNLGNANTWTGQQIFNTANVGIGSTNPGKTLDVNGTIRAITFINRGGTSSQFQKADGSLDSSTYLTGNQTITLSSDVTGSGTTAITTTLKNTGTAGTYRSTTFDAQGRETSGTNPTTFSGYAISDTSANLATAVTDHVGTGFSVFNGSPNFTGNVGIGSTNPGQVLDVQGTIRMTGFSLPTSVTSGYVLTASGTTGLGVWSPATGGGSGTVNSGTAGQGAYYASSTTAVSGTSSIFFSGASSGNNIGIGSATPGSLLDVKGTVRDIGEIVNGNVGIGTSFINGAGEGALSIMNGNVGIGTWVTPDALDVNGGINAKFRTGTTTSSTTPSIPVGVGGDDIYYITALSGAITTVTFTGTPYDGEEVKLIVTDNGTARAITLGAGSTIVATTVAAPTTTVISTPLLMEFRYQASNTTWYLIGVC